MLNIDPTVSFKCPCCLRRGEENWARKTEDGKFFCSGCDSTFQSRASALEDCPLRK